MKFAVKCLSVLAAASLLVTPALAAKKVKAKPAKAPETDVIKQWDADWKKFDKEVAGWFAPEKKKK